MATTTTNFGWDIPQSTDLVKDGATAIAALGQDIDTSMADLKGGTTGQVLAKQSNTDMDFQWVAQDDSNAIQNAIVDAKGDIITATANDTPARLPVGNNGETLVADSSTATGLRYKVPVTLANPVINGGFDVWQRGTSFSIAAASAYQYTADRWAVQNGANQAVTISRQTVSDTTNLPSIQYAARVQRNSGQTGTGDYYLDCPIETANSIPFVGRAVTLSFFARGGATFISAGDTLQAQLIYAVGTDQNPTTWTSPAIISSNTISLTSTMARYVVTGTVPSNATQLFIRFTHKPVGTAGATDYYDVTGVQISQNIDDNSNGSTTPPFRRSQGTIQGELAACQRYYYRTTVNSAYAYMTASVGADTTSTVYLPFTLPVEMRTYPATAEYGGAPSVSDGSTRYTGGTWALDTGGTKTLATVKYTHGSAALTQFRPYRFQANNDATTYFGFGAEL